MTAPGRPGRCVLVDVSADEAALLGELPRAEALPSAGLRARPAGALEPVDLVVIGSLATDPVSAVQHAHRLLPGASVAVLTADPAAVRRQVSFAPGVPLDLVIATVDESDLPDRLRLLRESGAGRRRHAAVLAAVARSAAAAAATPSPGLTAVGPLLEHAPIAVLVADPSGSLLGWNRRAEALLDLQPEMIGGAADELVAGAGPLITSAASSPGAGAAIPPRQVRVAGRVDLELSAVSSQTDEDRPVVLLLAADVTAHRQAERDRDRLAGQVELLAQVSESLMESLDVSESLCRLARALVPRLADWVAIQVDAEHDQLHDLVIHHRDPALSALTREAERLTTRRGCLTEPGRRAAAGEKVLLPHVAPGDLVHQVPHDDLRTLVDRLGMRSVLAVPIPGRAGVLGSLLLVNAPGSARFGETDLTLTAEIGRRAGIALENARLYAEQRHLATELQRSLLTAPPATPFADIAVRYVAAAQQAQVGGDWYDAFRRPGGDLVVVIGDVVGHDTRAAAAMGQVRGLVRGIGYTGPGGPAEVLSSVDEAIEGLELSTVASAVLARISPPQAGDGADGVRLRWSNAGHPSPLLLDPRGRVRVLEPESGQADLLLGITPGTRRHTEEIVLPAGSTLILYTDGLIERRRQSLDDGLRRLLSTVEAHAGTGLDRLCDVIVSRMVPHAGEDDVAIVAVRPRHLPHRRDRAG